MGFAVWLDSSSALRSQVFGVITGAQGSKSIVLGSCVINISENNMVCVDIKVPLSRTVVRSFGFESSFERFESKHRLKSME